MAGNGPAPKPAEQKRAEGTFRKDRDGSAEGTTEAHQAPPGRPRAPEGMPADALKIWKTLAPKLVRLKTLAKVDGGVLEAYCRNLATARALDQLANDNPVVETAHGPKINPAAAEARKRWELVKSLGADLGLSYAARFRAPIPAGEKPKDPAAAFLFGRQKSRAAEA